MTLSLLTAMILAERRERVWTAGGSVIDAVVRDQDAIDGIKSATKVALEI